MMSITEILRAHSVSRWHILSMTRSQNIAEHMYNVTMIGRHLCKILGLDSYEIDVIKYALEHDLDEVYYGDTPSPAKAMLDYDIPYNGNPLYSAVAKDIVGLADLLEAAWFLSQYYGNPTAKIELEKIKVRVRDKIGSLYKEQAADIIREFARELGIL